MASELRVERTEQFPSLAPSINFTVEPGVNEQGRLAAYLEIDCLRRQLAADVIAEAEQRAVAVGVGADRVLITGGTVSEKDYLRTLADSRGGNPLRAQRTRSGGDLDSLSYSACAPAC